MFEDNHRDVLEFLLLFFWIYVETNGCDHRVHALLLTECLNTAIEDIVEYVAKNKKFHLAKKSKDIASVAVSIVSFNMGMVSYYSIETFKLLFSHQVNDVPEIPLVVDSLQFSKTKELSKILYAFGCEDELATLLETKKIRPGV